MTHFKYEFHEESQQFMKRTGRKWLNTHRAPFVDKKRSKKKDSTVLDNKKSKKKVDLSELNDGGYLSFEFSESGSGNENESDMDIMDGQEIGNYIYDAAQRGNNDNEISLSDPRAIIHE